MGSVLTDTKAVGVKEPALVDDLPVYPATTQVAVP